MYSSRFSLNETEYGQFCQTEFGSNSLYDLLLKPGTLGGLMLLFLYQAYSSQLCPRVYMVWDQLSARENRFIMQGWKVALCFAPRDVDVPFLICLNGREVPTSLC